MPCPMLYTGWGIFYMRKEHLTMENNTGYTWSNKLSDIPDKSKVKVTMYNGYADTVTTKNNPAGIAALQERKRISKTEYVDSVGEIHEYKSSEGRDLKDTIKKIRKYIEYNFIDFECWHITLTYAEQEFNYAKAAHDCELFLGRLATRYKKYAFEYFRIIEPHANGAWHIHILVKSATEDIQIKLSASVITEVWGKGNATARQVGAIQEMINYFGTVHTHIKQNGHKLSKTEKKQLRWHYYPKRVRIYAKSNGIEEPPEDDTTTDELSDYLSEHGYDTNSSSQSSLYISDTETGVILNTINYQRFNKIAD